MNTTRRNQLRPLASIVCDLRNRLEEIAEEERTALDSTPENLVTTLEELESLLDEICEA